MKALAFLEAPDHVCGRYRVSAFASALDDCGWSLRVEGIASGLRRRLAQLRSARDFDCVLLQRKLLPGWQLAILRSAAPRLVFDFDDAILYRDSFADRGPFSRRRASRFSKTVSAADFVLAGNEFLADCTVSSGAKAARVRVVPTCVDPGRYPVAEHRDEGPLRLVWVGSSSTLRGLEERADLFRRLGSAVPGLTLRVVADRFPSFDPLKIEAVPWSEATEARAISGADVGVSLIPDDLWSRGKCGLKTLQYGAAGLPTIANPVGVHPKMIEPGRTGFLPATDEAWIAAVRLLAEDADRRRRMGQAARAKVEADYSVASWSGAFVAAIAGGLPGPAPLSPPLARKADLR